MCVAFLLLAVSVVAGGWYGTKIPFSQQWPLYEALRTTAAIIFAVVGAWLAIIYPERLRMTFKERKEKVIGEANIGKLFSPIVHSTLILSIVLIIGVVAPVLKQIDFLLPYKDVMRGASYAILVLLTFWQIWTVVLTLVPADMVKSHTDRDDAKQRAITGYSSLSKREKKTD